MCIRDRDTNFLGTSFCLDFHIAVPANGRVQLRNLVILGVIRIEIILPVKFAVTGDGTVGGQTHGHGVLYHLLIQHRQGTGHTGTHRTGMGLSLIHISLAMYVRYGTDNMKNGIFL